MKALALFLPLLFFSAISGDLPTQDCSSSQPGNAIPTCAIAIAGNSNGNLSVVPVSNATMPINETTAGTYQIAALSSGKSIYVTHFMLIANGTVNATLEYGTGTNCAVVVGTLVGPVPLTAQTGWVGGNGLGAIYIVPPSNELCLVLDQSVNVGGGFSDTVN